MSQEPATLSAPTWAQLNERDGATAEPLEAIVDRIEATERLARRTAAESYLHAFHYLLATARQDRPRCTAAELTPYFLQHVDKGKLLRKTTPGYAQLRGITEKKASSFLQLAVNLKQHAPQLLQRLHAGDIPAELVRTAAEKLKSVTPPRPDRDPAGQPWPPRAHQEALAETEGAKDNLGRELTQLAQPGIPEQDFLTRAGKLREEHHPHAAATRHRAAWRRRHLRVVPLADGMSRLEAMIASEDAESIVDRIRRRAAAIQRNSPQDRTKTQLEADTFVAELKTQRTGRDNRTSPAPGCAPGTSPAPEAAPIGSGATPSRGVTVFLECSFETWIRAGGLLAEGQLEFMRDYDSELFELASRNREFQLTPPSRRPSKHPPGVLQSTARATDLGSGRPISTELTAALLPQATMMQAIITHPATGYPIGLSKRARHPARRVKELLLYRDRHCRFPGCQVPGADCEVDHVHDWVLSQTSELYGLALMCKQHHCGKSAGWWRVMPRPDEGDGVLEFVFHTGRVVLTRPAKPLDPTAWQQLRQQLEAPPF